MLPFLKIIQTKKFKLFLKSNFLQESIKTKNNLTVFSTDHSPITLSLCPLKEFPRGRGKSLIKNENYQELMRTLIENVRNNLDQDNIVDPQFLEVENKK